MKAYRTRITSALHMYIYFQLEIHERTSELKGLQQVLIELKPFNSKGLRVHSLHGNQHARAAIFHKDE